MVAELVEVDELWTAYKATGDTELRNRLVVHYRSMVSYLATRIAMGLPLDGAEQADLVSFGIEALIKTIDRFDPTLGWKFETYAFPRIRFGIIDRLRKQDWVPRSVRRKARAIAHTTCGLEMTLGRDPTDSDIAEHMGLTETDVATIRREAHDVRMLSLTPMAYQELEDGPHRMDRSRLSSLDSPEDSVAITEMQRQLSAGIAGLGERDRVLLALAHREGLSGDQIAVVLGCSAARVSQLLTEAVLALAARLECIPA